MNKKCPKCGRFLSVEEINFGIDDNDFKYYYICNNCKYREEINE